MTEQNRLTQTQTTIITFIIIAGIVVILSIAVLTTFISSKNSLEGTVVLPGGVTYTGKQ